MFDLLTNKLQKVFKDLRGLGKITENNVGDSLREVRWCRVVAMELRVASRETDRQHARQPSATDDEFYCFGRVGRKASINFSIARTSW